MEDQDSLISEQQEDPFKEHTIEQKSIQQEYLDHNLNIQYSNQMIGLCSPSPFKKQQFPNLNEESYQQGCLENKYRKQSALYRLILQQNSPISDHQNEILKNQENQKELKSFKDYKTSEKSLKNLSRSVYKIILSLQIATYKEIARQLLFLHKRGIKQEDQLPSKQQQNIRRRVYDAINVMVSAGVVQRNGKKVIFQNKLREIKNYILDENLLKLKQKDHRCQSYKLKLFLKNKKKIVEGKKCEKEKLLNQLLALKNIIQINKSRKNMIQNNQKIINFPIIGIIHNNEKQKIKLDNSKERFKIKIDRLSLVIGDIDFILKINQKQRESQQRVTKKQINKNITFIF